MDENIDVEYLERVANETFPGTAMYVRDVNLPVELAAKYTPGLIIKERSFVDASQRVMGMVTTHRYGILSNHMRDISEFEHGTNWGLCLANRDSHFKVLAVHEFSGKTLILLLHLPDNDDWRVFENATFSIEKYLVKSSIERFENKCNVEPIPELATEAWLDRCSFPLGMDDDGALFPL